MNAAKLATISGMSMATRMECSHVAQAGEAPNMACPLACAAAADPTPCRTKCADDHHRNGLGPNQDCLCP